MGEVTVRPDKTQWVDICHLFRKTLNLINFKTLIKKPRNCGIALVLAWWTARFPRYAVVCEAQVMDGTIINTGYTLFLILVSGMVNEI